jgi:hypothetical protein
MNAIPATTQILTRFLAECKKPAELLLGFLAADDDVRTGPPDPAAVIGRLAEEFPVEELLASGVAVRGEGDVLAIAAGLVEGPFIVLRHALSREPFDLLTDRGCLTDALPALQAVADFRTQKLFAAADDILYAAFCVADVILLRACGLAATLVHGLDSWPIVRIDRLCQAFDLTIEKTHDQGDSGAGDDTWDDDTSGDDDEDEDDTQRCPENQVRPRLVVVAWTPSALSPAVPVQLEPVMNYFQLLHKHMGLELLDLLLWKADNSVLERLQFFCDHRCKKRFRRTLADSADTVRVCGLGPAQAMTLDLPLDYPAAVARLHEASADPDRCSLQQWKIMWNDVEKQLNAQVLAPLRVSAMRAEDPIARNLLVATAQVSHLFHIQALLANEQVLRSVSQGGVAAIELPAEQCQRVLALADRVLKMTQEAERCIQPTISILPMPSLELPFIPRLPHSTSQPET